MSENKAIEPVTAVRSAWQSAGPMVDPVHITVETPLGPGAAAEAIARAIREKRYWDPRMSRSPFLRLAGTCAGPEIDLAAILYVLPVVRARAARLTIRGKLEPTDGGSVLSAVLGVPDPVLGWVPLIGNRWVESTHNMLVEEAAGVRELLIEILEG